MHHRECEALFPLARYSIARSWLMGGMIALFDTNEKRPEIMRFPVILLTPTL